MTVGALAAAQASARSFDGGSASCNVPNLPSTCHLYHFKLVGNFTIKLDAYDATAKLVESYTRKRHNSANSYVDGTSLTNVKVSISDFYGPKSFANNANHCFDTFRDGGVEEYTYRAQEVTNRNCNDK